MTARHTVTRTSIRAFSLAALMACTAPIAQATGDRDLLALQGQLRCAIVTAEGFQSALDLR